MSQSGESLNNRLEKIEDKNDEILSNVSRKSVENKENTIVRTVFAQSNHKIEKMYIFAK
jgi:hypothetical protein